MIGNSQVFDQDERNVTDHECLQSSTTIAPMDTAMDNPSGENLPPGQAVPHQIVPTMTAPSTAPPYRFLPETGTNSADGGKCEQH